MVDWDAIKTEYITRKASYRKLGEKYGVNKDRIARRAQKEGWQDKRETQRDNVTTKALDKVAEQDSDRLAKLMEATNLAVDVAVAALEAGPKDQDIRGITAALKDLTGLMRDFYNIPTPAQREAQRIAGERLRLEQLKAEADKNDDKDVEVLFTGEDMGDLSG